MKREPTVGDVGDAAGLLKRERRGRRPLLIVFLAAAALAAACSREPAIEQVGSGGSSFAADGTPMPGENRGASSDATIDSSGGSSAGLQDASRPASPTGSPGETPSPTTAATTPKAGSAVGIAEDTITISVSLPLTSAYGAIAEKAYRHGVEVWQREVNANGGIHGRTIVIKKVDNQNTSEGAVAACKEERSNGSFAVLGLISQPQEDDCLDAAGVPVMNRAAADYKPTWRHVLAETRTQAFAPTNVSFLRSSYVNGGGKKIGIVYTGDMSQTVVAYESTAAEARKQGLELVHVEKVATGQASFVSEMSRMRGSGAQVVLMITVVESPGILRDAAAIGYKPKWVTDIHGASLDSICQAAGPNCAGVWGVRLWTGSNDPAFRAYLDKVRKHQGESAARSADTSDAGIYGSAEHFGKLLELAGPNPTRESFLAAARAMDPHDNKLTGPITFKGRSEGIRALFPIQCCNPDGTFKVLGPAREQF